MAEGVFRKHIDDHAADLAVRIDSAGTHSYHQGSGPDPRAVTAAVRRGVDISDLQARRVEASDFENFDYILAMDQENLEFLLEEAEETFHAKIRLFLDFSAARPGADVPDPYYGEDGFEGVFQICQRTCEEILEHLCLQHSIP